MSDDDFMTRFDWFLDEISSIPRKKFHIFEAVSSADVQEVEENYGPLPADYREFVQQFGRAKLFRHPRNRWHCILVFAPPTVRNFENETSLELGHYYNEGDAWIEWINGAFLNDGAVLVGHSGKRRSARKSFEDWLKRSVAACKRLYSAEQWAEILKPPAPFTDREEEIVEALPHFLFRKVGVTPDGNVLIEIENRSSLELSSLTIGVRSETGMQGAATLRIAGLAPGTKRTLEENLYRGAMDPQQVELFSLPLPDAEDRPYYPELQS